MNEDSLTTIETVKRAGGYTGSMRLDYISNGTNETNENRYNYVDNNKSTGGEFTFGSGTYADLSQIDSSDYYTLFLSTNYKLLVPQGKAYVANFKFDLDLSLTDIDGNVDNLNDESFATYQLYYAPYQFNEYSMQYTIPKKVTDTDNNKDLLDYNNSSNSTYKLPFSNIANIQLTKAENSKKLSVSFNMTVSNMGTPGINKETRTYLKNDIYNCRFFMFITYTMPKDDKDNGKVPRVTVKGQRNIRYSEITDVKQRPYILKRYDEGSIESLYLMDSSQDPTYYYDYDKYRDHMLNDQYYDYDDYKTSYVFNGNLDLEELSKDGQANPRLVYRNNTNGNGSYLYVEDGTVFNLRNFLLGPTMQLNVAYKGTFTINVDYIGYDTKSFDKNSGSTFGYINNTSGTINLNSYDNTAKEITLDLDYKDPNNNWYNFSFKFTGDLESTFNISKPLNVYTGKFSQNNTSYTNFEIVKQKLNTQYPITLYSSVPAPTNNYFVFSFKGVAFNYTGTDYAIVATENTQVLILGERGLFDGSPDEYNIHNGGLVKAYKSKIFVDSNERNSYANGTDYGYSDFTGIKGTVFDLTESSVVKVNGKAKWKFKGNKNSSSAPDVNIHSIGDDLPIILTRFSMSYIVTPHMYIKLDDSLIEKLGTDPTDESQILTLIAFDNTYGIPSTDEQKFMLRSIKYDSSIYSFAYREIGNTTNTKYPGYAYLYKKHIHNLKHVEAKAAMCDKVGNIEYWYCDDNTAHTEENNNYFEQTFYTKTYDTILDNTIQSEDYNSLILPAIGHKYNELKIVSRNGQDLRYHVGEEFRIEELLVTAQCTNDPTLHGENAWAEIKPEEMEWTKTVDLTGLIKIKVTKNLDTGISELTGDYTVQIINDEIDFTEGSVNYKASSKNNLLNTEYANGVKWEAILKADPVYSRNQFSIYSKIRLVNLENTVFENNTFLATVLANSNLTLNSEFVIYRVTEDAKVKQVGKTYKNDGNAIAIDFVKEFGTDFISAEYYFVSHTHTMVHVNAVDTTCQHSGNYEYWMCENIGEHSHSETIYFKTSDYQGEVFSSLEETVIPQVKHNYFEIVIETKPTKLNYEKGEKIDLSGLVVKIHCNNDGTSSGHYEEVSLNDLKLSSDTATNEDVKNQTITLSYAKNLGLKASFDITIGQQDNNSTNPSEPGNGENNGGTNNNTNNIWNNIYIWVGIGLAILLLLIILIIVIVKSRKKKHEKYSN